MKRGEVTVTRGLLAATAVKLGIKRPSWWGVTAKQQELPLNTVDTAPQTVLGSGVVKGKEMPP